MKQKMRKLTAIKAHRYATRQLVAGDEYEAPSSHALALVLSKKARFALDSPKEQPVAPPAPSPVVERKSEPAAADVIDDLRARAKELGIEVDNRWGAPRLRYEINQARKD